MANPVEIRERIRPGKLESLMKIARILADDQSTCLRKQVACLAVLHPSLDQIVSIGVNGNERGGPNICDSPMDSGGCGCLHAEQNCLTKLRTGEPVILICTHSPCVMCAKSITIPGNVRAIYYGMAFRDPRGLEILTAANIEAHILH